MYPTTQEQAIIHAAERLMEDTMKRYDVSHDALHVQRVRKTALSLARSLSKEPRYASNSPDLLVIELGALLHDVLDKKYVSAEQAEDPYAFFEPFFIEMKHLHGLDLISDGRARLVTRVIENVSWSTEKKMQKAGLISDWHKTCVELHCVQDADRLDAIGAFGIMRCAAYSAATNRPLHVPSDDRLYEESSVGHFYDKLLNIRDALKTEPARKSAEKRHHLMLQFLAGVDEEYDAKF